MTTSERIEQQSFCYDPDFPPDVAEGHPLAEAKPAAGKAHDGRLRRALRAAAAFARHGRV